MRAARLKALRIMLGAGTALACSGAAAAQTPPDQTPPEPNTAQLGEILVTAQRRSESLQSVPIAITAFSAESLEAKGIQSTLQMVQFVPNLFGANNTGLGSANTYFIRGLGSVESVATFDPSVGTYIDDIYLSRQNANNFNFFDIDRLEVLRGPQGTLFGRNTTGGAVNVILKKPGTVLGGFGEVAYGAYNRVMVRGSIDMPLSSGIGFKLSGYYQDDAGYVRNTTTGERLNDVDGAGLRGALRFDITPDVEWNVSVAYIRSSGENAVNFACDPRDPANCSGRFAPTGLRKPTSSPAPLAISGRKAEFGVGNETDTIIAISNLEWRSEAATLNVITGVVDLQQKFHLDFADGRGLPTVADPIPAVRGFPLGGFGILNDGKHKQFSQEVKLSGSLFGGALDYVTGLYLLDEDNSTDFADTFAVFTGAHAPLQLLLAERTLNNTAKATAGYFQGDLNLSEQLKLTAGIRYTDETKTFRISDNRQACNASLAVTCLNQTNLVAANGVPIPTSQNVKIWTPRFVLNYTPSDSLLLFASATRGFKSGGWNARGTAANELLPFGPETVWSYEAGIKSEWFDRRLRVNVTGFWLDNQDLQAPSAFVRANGSIAFIAQNFADYRNKGVELEITAVPVDGLNLFANIGFQDDEYRLDPTAPRTNEYGVTSVARQLLDCRAQIAAGQVPLSSSNAAAGAPPNNAPACAAGIVDANGNLASPVRTPQWTVAVGGTYDWRLPAPGIIITPSVNVSWRSSYQTGTANGTIYTGAITAGAGGGNRTFPANPFGGDFITGSDAPGFAVVNAGIAMRTDDRNWTLAVECQNCLDKVFLESTLANYTYLSYPRFWQVRAKRVF
ncbi:TonB-dependent receptor [Polymorphobacter multimanifer]|uniref:TonB-dependent receptor n=1 Tax=Polymorphobacter multimanifer TaxID=1070431 RepID=UPI0019B538F7|nr:TonB-dependent receptor [Polymorphobacter multimanifer]GGI82812.1 TonB-dependent receptor [Polymorphobacter multimanifer]